MLRSSEHRHALVSDALVRLYLSSPTARSTPPGTHQHHHMPDSGPWGVSPSNFFPTTSK